MIKKFKRKNNQKEETIMKNNINEELNQNIENINEEITKTTEKVTETQKEITEESDEIIKNPEEVTEIPEVETPEEFTKTNIKENINEANEVIGKINGFEKLYVRSQADKESEPVGIVNTLDELYIDLEKSTEEFYKVLTSNGLEGYCIKKFVKID